MLHLPTIVEAAVASPGAAAAAAAQIRKFLSKENYARPHVQYNAVMVIRILADNPGQSFTKNLDKNFSDTVKHLLRHGQDPSVMQILRETLDALDREKAYDTNLNTLFLMWRKERALMASARKEFGPRTMSAPPWTGPQQPPRAFGNGQAPKGGLPPPVELVGRIEEARTSAKLLLQLVQSTPAHELLGNDLVKEFSERCMSAQRSIQGYINCDNPPPDDDTMLTLIETNEQLSLAASKHQRAVLQARRIQGPSPSPSVPRAESNYVPPAPPSTVSAATYDPSPMSPYVPSPVSTYDQPQPPPPRSEAPVLPPLDVSSRDDNRRPSATSYKSDLPLPPSLQAAPGRHRSSTFHEEDRDKNKDADVDTDNPFADHHSPNYSALPGPAPPVPRVLSGSTYDDESPVVGHGRGTPQSPDLYNAGYKPTPSHLGREERVSNEGAGHGASLRRELTEEEEYARDYPVNRGGRPDTPEQSGRRPRDSDVSPIAERGALTYRY